MAIIRGEQISGSVALANYSISSSYALTASYVLGLGTIGNKILSDNVEALVNSTGNIFLIKSGSYNYVEVDYTGSTTLTSDASTVFLIKNFGGNPILTVSQSGMIILATQSAELVNPAPNGGIYFTSNSFFVGLD
jgi:hypothetical protein